MAPLDHQEKIAVTLTLDDWATIMAALSVTEMDLTVRYRINESIFSSARETERLLS